MEKQLKKIIEQNDQIILNQETIIGFSKKVLAIEKGNNKSRKKRKSPNAPKGIGGEFARFVGGIGVDEIRSEFISKASFYPEFKDGDDELSEDDLTKIFNKNRTKILGLEWKKMKAPKSKYKQKLYKRIIEEHQKKKEEYTKALALYESNKEEKQEENDNLSENKAISKTKSKTAINKNDSKEKTKTKAKGKAKKEEIIESDSDSDSDTSSSSSDTDSD